VLGLQPVDVLREILQTAGKVPGFVVSQAQFAISGDDADAGDSNEDERRQKGIPLEKGKQVSFPDSSGHRIHMGGRF
jgi:hypothetical protein